MGSPASDNQNPLPAYQYFENIRNFLVAVEELKLPTFEASDLERVNCYLFSHMQTCILLAHLIAINSQFTLIIIIIMKSFLDLIKELGQRDLEHL